MHSQSLTTPLLYSELRIFLQPILANTLHVNVLEQYPREFSISYSEFKFFNDFRPLRKLVRKLFEQVCLITEMKYLATYSCFEQFALLLFYIKHLKRPIKLNKKDKVPFKNNYTRERSEVVRIQTLLCSSTCSSNVSFQSHYQNCSTYIHHRVHSLK